MDDLDPVALSWWTALTPKDRTHYRCLVARGTTTLLPAHAHDLAAAGLPPLGWWNLGSKSSAADNDVVHRFEVVLGGGRDYGMPDPVRELIRADLDRTPLTDADTSPQPWWRRLPRAH